MMERPTEAVDPTNSVLVFPSNISSTPPPIIMTAASSLSLPLQEEEYLFVAEQETNYNNQICFMSLTYN